MKIAIDLIEPGQRLRATDPAQVQAIAESIGDVGQLNPITVYARKTFRSGQWVDGFGLVAGAHRLEACQRLGLVEIDAHLVELSDLQRQIAECDENLVAPSLTPADRARFMRRRKEAYEALHPEAKAGAIRANAANAAMGRDVAANFAPTFAADTAKATGQSERTVQLHSERGEKILPEVLAMIRGTPLDTGAYMDKLKKMPGSDQFRAAKRDLAFERANARKAAAKAAKPAPTRNTMASGDAHVRMQTAAIRRAWDAAGRAAQKAFAASVGLRWE